MQIQTNRQNFTPQFKALHIANTGNLKLYRLAGNADKKYLTSLAERIKTGELMPNLSKQEVDRWDEMLKYAVFNAQNLKNITYLETCNNRPCGIITFRTDNKTTFLDCICTFPTQVGERVKLAGKTLFYQIFSDILPIKNGRVELEAITNGPFDVVKKYEDLGFKRTSRVYPTKVVMEMSGFKLKETFNRLRELIDYTPLEPEKVNLSQTLD